MTLKKTKETEPKESKRSKDGREPIKVREREYQKIEAEQEIKDALSSSEEE